jgi:hypothetical protein
MQMTAGLNRRRFCGATATVVPGTLGSPFLAAWEEPKLFSEEMRAAFKPLR